MSEKLKPRIVSQEEIAQAIINACPHCKELDEKAELLKENSNLLKLKILSLLLRFWIAEE